MEEKPGVEQGAGGPQGAGRAELSRRQFVALATSSAASAAAGGASWPRGGLAFSAASGAEPQRAIRLAYLSDAHVAFDHGAQRSFRAMVRAIDEINALAPQPDLVVFGGDLTHAGRPHDLRLAAHALAQLRAPVKMVAGEHDWYGGAREPWQALFGPAQYAFVLRGVAFVVLLSVHLAASWPGHQLRPARQLEALVACGPDGPAYEVGEAGRAFLAATLAPLPDQTPVVVLCHAPPYPLAGPSAAPPTDGPAVLALLRRFAQVTVLHGHTHRVLRHQVGNVASFGMASTAWPWPHPPGALPAPTLALHRAHPHGGLSGCGHGQLQGLAAGRVTHTYNLWHQGVVVVA